MTCKNCGKETDIPFHTCKQPSQIAVRAAAALYDDGWPDTFTAANEIQSAIDKATAGMVPIEDVKPLLGCIPIPDLQFRLNQREAFLALHGDKLK